MADNAAAAPVKAGHTAERVGYFTDAVFAIAMTLLVIEIPRPEAADFEVGDGVSKAQASERLWRFLVAQHSAFYAYVLAFYLLWIVWRQHHVLLDQVSRVSASMIGWHFPLLLLAAFLPYATAVEGHYPANPAASLLFGLVVGGLLLSRTVIQAQASRGDVLLPNVDRRLYRATVAGSWIIVGYWAATLVLGVVGAVDPDPLVPDRASRIPRPSHHGASAGGPHARQADPITRRPSIGFYINDLVTREPTGSHRGSHPVEAPISHSLLTDWPDDTGPGADGLDTRRTMTCGCGP